MVVVAITAFAASGETRVLAGALAVGAVVASVHVLVRLGLSRAVPAPRARADAPAAERARVMRPHVIRLTLIVIAIAAVALALAATQGGPSTLGVLYLSLPVVVALVSLAAVLRKARK